jgi:hypothetical protein
LFVCIDIAYNFFERDVLARAAAARLSGHTPRGEASIGRGARDLRGRDDASPRSHHSSTQQDKVRWEPAPIALCPLAPVVSAGMGQRITP